MITFGILGPVEASEDGRRLEIGGRQQVRLLAFLLLHADRAVPAERLAETLWDGGATIKAVQVAVARLRRALGPGGAATELSTVAGGYRLSPAPGAMDAAVFEKRVAEGQRLLTTGAARDAATTLREALGLWRGPALADVAYDDFAQDEIRRLEDLRASAAERLLEAELALGRHAEVLAEIELLAAEHPDREGLACQLMLALYRNGRQSEALQVYQRVRTWLDERGLQPGHGLQELQAAILRHAPELRWNAPAAAVDDGGAAPSLGFTARAGAGAFVGRSEAVELLQDRWGRAEDGVAQLVLIEGRPGIGKTRLAFHFAERLADAGAAALYGRTDEDALLPYQPFAEALVGLLGRGGADGPTGNANERDVLGDLTPSLRAPTVERPPDAASNRYGLYEDLRRYELLETVATVLGRTAAARPLLLVIDDLHWATKPTLLMLRHVLRRNRATRLLVIGTYRPPSETSAGPGLGDFLTDLRRELQFDVLRLAGLDDDETADLVTDLLGAPAPPSFVRALHDRTDGNPFFIEETVRAIIDVGLAADQLDAPGPLESVRVPESIEATIVSRVSRLAPETQELLGVASVVGPSASLDVLEAVADVGDVVAAVEEGLDAGLLAEGEQSDTVSFAHALVREVLYSRLSAVRRRRLHHRVATALEQLPATLEPAELARHYSLARGEADAEAACRYAVAAGRRAAEMFAYDDAIRHFRYALDLLPADREAERCDVTLALGRVQWHAGDDGATASFVEAAQSARSRGASDQLARAALGLGERYFEVTYMGSRYRDLLEQALAALGPQDRPERALLLSRLAVNLAFPNESALAHEMAREAVEMARGFGDAQLLTAVLLARHVTLLDVAHIDERLALSDELAAQSGEHQELIAERHYWRMYDLLGVGRAEEAQRELDRLELLADRLAQPLFRSIAAGARGLFADLEGDDDGADRWATTFRGHAARAHTRDALSAWAGQVYARRRRHGRSDELIEVVGRLADSGGRDLGWRAAHGLLCAERGDRAKAVELLEAELADGVDALPRGMFWLARIAALSELAVALGDAPACAELYRVLAPHRGRQVVVAYCAVWGPVEGYLSLLAEATGNLDCAAEHASAALGQARTMGAERLSAELDARVQSLSPVDAR